MKNCLTLVFVALVITLPSAHLINDLILTFLRSIDIWEAEPLPIIFYMNHYQKFGISGNTQAQNKIDYYTTSMLYYITNYHSTGISFIMSVTNNLHDAYCDKDLRNKSGILLAILPRVADAIQFLSEVLFIQFEWNMICNL